MTKALAFPGAVEPSEIERPEFPMGVNDWSLPARPRARLSGRNALQHDPRRRTRFIVRVFMLADVIALSVAFAATEYLFHRQSAAPRQLSTWEETVVAALALPTWIFLAKASSLFLNDYTLEVDLFRCGRHKSLCKTITELTEVQVAKQRAEAWVNNPETLDAPRFLSDIEVIGKGRFAQRLAGYMGGKLCPAYIREAIEHVIGQIR